jgi:hypothetical protein
MPTAISSNVPAPEKGLLIRVISVAPLSSDPRKTCGLFSPFIRLY